MSFDLAEMRRLVARHGPVTRVVVAATAGSTPREVGAAMCLWPGGQSGTIGGGALELRASQLAPGVDRTVRLALGPALGQCCGGAVTLVIETWSMARLDGVTGDVLARGPGAMPPAVRRHLAVPGAALTPRLVGGWMVEPVTAPTRPLWIFGAGHVGRALVGVLEPLPGLAITWIDVAQARFPAEPGDAIRLIAANPAEAVARAPLDAEHLIVTHSHALDLDICHGLLGRGFATAGLIGSATKWARFRTRLSHLGHSDASISRIRCPIGQPEFGKHPQAIAVGVAAQLLSRTVPSAVAKEPA